MKVKRQFILKGVLFAISALALIVRAGVLFAQEGTAPDVPADPTIVAPGQLSDRELHGLQSQYRFDVRQKGIALKPSITTSFAGEPSISGIVGETLTDEGKLYRYFGVATVLSKIGRLEESIEILEYILYKDPNNKYIEDYLRKVKDEFKEKKTAWEKTTKKDAALLKKTRLNELKENGIAYYKQKEYDKALLSFSDALMLDPENNTAQRYMDKLYGHYMREVKAEDIAIRLERETAKELDSSVGIETAAEDILDEFDYIAKDNGSAIKRKDISEKLLDTTQLGQVVIDKKADSLLDNLEREFRISEIIAQRKEEEERARAFTLGPGDVLNISVRDHPELSGTSLVRPEGAIILPLVNEGLMVKDLTLGEIRQKIEESLQRYVQDPTVYVGIERFTSKTFYVIDESGSTPYNITRRNFTLRDALFVSDWGNDRALGRVMVIKPHKIHPIVKKIDAFDMIYRGNLAKNIKIEDGDVIYVPMTAASKITETITDALSPAKAVKDLRNEWLDQRWNRNSGWRHLLSVPTTVRDQAEYSAPGGFN